MDKRVLRRQALDNMKILFKTNEKQIIEQSIYKHLFSSELWHKAKTIGLTMSLPNEWNTVPILTVAWEMGKRVAVPKSNPSNKQLNFYIYEPSDRLEPGHAGILEPNPETAQKITTHMIDLLIVPGLLYDRRGYRIGFGGGYYDRFLQTYTNCTISITSENQIIKAVPDEPHDQKVNYLITENGCYQTVKN